MSARQFDDNELARVTANAAGSQTCIKLEKLSEGDFFKGHPPCDG